MINSVRGFLIRVFSVLAYPRLPHGCSNASSMLPRLTYLCSSAWSARSIVPLVGGARCQPHLSTSSPCSMDCVQLALFLSLAAFLCCWPLNSTVFLLLHRSPSNLTTPHPSSAACRAQPLRQLSRVSLLQPYKLDDCQLCSLIVRPIACSPSLLMLLLLLLSWRARG